MSNYIDEINNKRIEEYIPELTYKSDGTYRGCCPIHGGSNETSFVVFPDNKYYCFACHSGGNLINYKMDLDKIPFDLAVERLAKDFNIPLDKEYQQEKEECQTKLEIAEYYRGFLGEVKDYLTEERGLSLATIEKYKLGYNPQKKAITIPMFDLYGRVVSFGYRYFEGSIKYKNGKNTSLYEKGKFLFGTNFAIGRLKDSTQLYVCEGFFDVMSADEQGLPCVAYNGITISKNHIGIIKHLCGKRDIEIILVPDNDGKASKFIARAKSLFQIHYPKAIVRVMAIEDGYKDLNDLHKAGKNISEQRTLSIDMYLVEQILQENGIEVQKKKIIELSKTITDPLVKLEIVEYLANKWDKPIDTIKDFLSVESESVEEIINDFATVNSAADCLVRTNEEPILTGFSLLDESINFYKKQISCIAASSNTGKTDFLIEMLLHQSIIQKKNIIFFSLEMSKEDIIKIILAKLLQMKRYQVREFAKNFPSKINEILSQIGERLLIVDKVLSLKEIEQRIKVANTRVFDTKGVDIVAIDHFTLLKGNTTVEAQQSNGDTLIQLAKDNNVCLILLSQLNKGSQSLDKGKIREPMLTDLMGSSALGNACTNVVGLWRPERTPNIGEIEREKWKNITRAKILKYRELMLPQIYFEFKYNIETSRLEQIIEGENNGE